MTKADKGLQRFTKVYKAQLFLIFALILCPSFSNITLVVGNINADHVIDTILFQSENFFEDDNKNTLPPCRGRTSRDGSG